MSLPAALYLDEATIPKHNPYLFADPELVVFWREQLQPKALTGNQTLAHHAPLRIGICWQADLPHDESRLPVARRSIPLALLAQLADIPGVTLYSLQTHEHNAACHTQELEGCIQTFDYKIDTEHGPFMDTAALIANMDIVITVDTATAHLAAALGKPTWLLLPYATDWRWIAHRTDSPWHPTMRIFKQPKPFDWQSVVNAVRQSLMQETIRV
jgi:ADP-heptose:LPS heptosyltransferase